MDKNDKGENDTDMGKFAKKKKKNRSEAELAKAAETALKDEEREQAPVYMNRARLGRSGGRACAAL